MSIERLRALEKAVELVAKATRGPWAFMNEKYDDCLLAFGTDTLDHDAPPPWYSCWTNINPDDGRALIAAVNFIREHGSALIAELGQEVGAEQADSCCTEDDGCPTEMAVLKRFWRQHSSPAHTSEARDAVSAELERAVRKFPTWPTDPLHAVAVLGEEFGELTKAVLQSVYEPHKVQPGEVRAEAVQTAAMAMRFLQSLDAYVYAGCEQHSQDAAMRQEAGDA